MIKIKVNKGDAEIEIIGNVTTLAAECIMGIRGVYQSIQQDDPKCAEILKDIIVNNISLFFCDCEKLKKEKEKKVKESVSDTLKELAEILDDGGSLTDVIQRLHKELEVDK